MSRRKVTVTLTEAEAYAMRQALTYHLEHPSDILGEPGEQDAEQLREERVWKRAVLKLEAALGIEGRT